MQITNNYQLNFKAATVDREALKILSQRLKPGELRPFIKRFKERHNTDEYDIILGALSKYKPQLDACITYDNKHFRHITEGFFSSLFRNPKVFMNKINRAMDEDFVSIGTKGHIKTTILDKLAYFLL